MAMFSPGSSRGTTCRLNTANPSRAIVSTSGAQTVAAPSLVNCSPIASVAVGPVGNARNTQLDRARSSCSWARRYAFLAHTTPQMPIRPLTAIPTHSMSRNLPNHGVTPGTSPSHDVRHLGRQRHLSGINITVPSRRTR